VATRQRCGCISQTLQNIADETTELAELKKIMTKLQQPELLVYTETNSNYVCHVMLTGSGIELKNKCIVV